MKKVKDYLAIFSFGGPVHGMGGDWKDFDDEGEALDFFYQGEFDVMQLFVARGDGLYQSVVYRKDFESFIRSIQLSENMFQVRRILRRHGYGIEGLK